MMATPPRMETTDRTRALRPRRAAPSTSPCWRLFLDMTEKISATTLIGHRGQKQDRMARTRKSLGLDPSGADPPTSARTGPTPLQVSRWSTPLGSGPSSSSGVLVVRACCCSVPVGCWVRGVCPASGFSRQLIGCCDSSMPGEVGVGATNQTVQGDNRQGALQSCWSQSDCRRLILN